MNNRLDDSAEALRGGHERSGQLGYPVLVVAGGDPDGLECVEARRQDLWQVAVCLGPPQCCLRSAFRSPSPRLQPGYAARLAVRPMLSAIRRKCSLGNRWPRPRSCRAKVRWLSRSPRAAALR
jgi:hypothetical protein